MGNCLKSPTSDDISLLHESQSDRASYGDGADPDLEPPPPYQQSAPGRLTVTAAVPGSAANSMLGRGNQVILFYVLFSLCLQEQIHVPIYHPTPSQARLATQLTEEEQVRIAQRIGLIQHLPKGVYDPGRDGSEKKIR
ncbi:hypothetical protein FQN60_013012, partial [Etheostoma spectabile]